MTDQECDDIAIFWQSAYSWARYRWPQARAITYANRKTYKYLDKRGKK